MDSFTRPIKTDSSNINARRNSFLVINFLFFTLFYLYVWLRIDPRLIYYNSPELFLLDARFFKNFLYYPGGIADYISKFLLEFNYFPLSGPFIITLLTFFICLSYKWFLQNITNRHMGGLFFVPAILILIIYNRYLSISMVGLLSALVFANIYRRANHRRDLFRITLYVVLSIIMYCYFVYSYWIFASLCAIWEIIKNRKYILAWVYLGIETLIFLLSAKYILYIAGRNIIYYLFPFFYSANLGVRLLILGLLLLTLTIFFLKIKSIRSIFALFVLVFVSFQFWAEVWPNKILYTFLLLLPTVLIIPYATSKTDLRPSIAKWNKIFVLLFVVLSPPVLILTFNKDAHALLKINYLSHNKMWEGVLREAKAIPPDLYKKNKFLYQIVFKALYHAGRLPYEQFDYPHFLLLSMPYPRPNSELMHHVSPIEISDTCFSLGLINHSELMASWAMQKSNEPVRALKQLVFVYIVKGNKKAAKVILNRFKKSFIYRDWAQKYLMFLEDDTLLTKDKHLRDAKSRMIKADNPKDEDLLIRIATKYDYEGVFKRLLAENRDNKMAFEYLMSYYLFMGKTERVIYNLNRLKEFGYSDVPHNYQEAILINAFKASKRILGSYEEEVDKITAQEYSYFDEVYRRHGYDKVATYNALKEEHGNSYFLYYIMLTTGKKK